MADEKLPSYTVAYNERLKQIQEGIHSEHRGNPPSRDPETEIKPSKDSQQLGEGTRR